MTFCILEKSAFLITNGAAGKGFIEEMIRLVNSWTYKSDLETTLLSIDDYALFISSKTFLNSKSKENSETLKRTLSLWKNWQLDQLMFEGKIIQDRLQNNDRVTANNNKEALTFAQLIEEGKVNKAIKKANKGEILPVSGETFEILQQKHPKTSEASDEILLKETPQEVHPVIYESINSEMVKDAIKKTRGAAGSSGMDADGWRCILISGNFENVGEEPQKSIAKMAEILCQERSANYLAAFLACRLIPLDKQPGVGPIGTGDVLRQVIGKIVMRLLRNDILKAGGSLQLCAGQDAGSEAAIHAVYDMFNEENTEAVLMVDASNAFNSINREVFLHKTKVLYLALATFINTCHSIPSDLFAQGGKRLKSLEETTQGDPAAMAIYALGITPLLAWLSNLSKEKNRKVSIKASSICR